MVDQSSLPFRMLCRQYDTNLCYTPMFHSKMFMEQSYRTEQWSTVPEDRPLFVQFCANDPDMLLAAALMVQKDCDAVDLNLGCPQGIARKGHYGAFLQEDPQLIFRLINTLAQNLTVPVTAKMRRLATIEETVRYAKMIESAGASVIAVHGRTRDQKGSGRADWEYIAAVKKAVSVPVIANGNIQFFGDVQRCIDATGVDAVMSAVSLLEDPALFSGTQVPPCQLARQLLGLTKTHKTGYTTKSIKSHLFRIFATVLEVHPDLREELGCIGCADYPAFYAKAYEFVQKIEELPPLPLLKPKEAGTVCKYHQRPGGCRNGSSCPDPHPQLPALPASDAGVAHVAKETPSD
jgi:tRNA-dihydrouridine synthase 1